jgi:hypothetical protein
LMIVQQVCWEKRRSMLSAMGAVKSERGNHASCC